MSDVDHTLLLTGRPGVGKTTVIREVAEELGDDAAGFYTEEIRENGQRRGFRIVAFDGWSRVMAHVDVEDGPRVSKYAVDVEAVDEAVARLPERASLFVIDEIGKMECHSEAFVERVRELLEDETPLLATVARRGGGVMAEAREHPDAELVEVSRENRDALPERILEWVREGSPPSHTRSGA